MRLRFAIVTLLLTAAPLQADAPTVKSIREESPTLAEQRDRLRTLAVQSETSSPEVAGEAWLGVARAYEYEGAADSAIASYRRAIERRGHLTELVAAADALLRRSGSGDAEEALNYSDRAVNAGMPDGSMPSQLRARQAWARFLTGRTAEARTMFSRMERSLYRDPLWLLRMGQVALENDEPGKAFAMLYPVAILSRGQADDAMQLISKVADRLGASNKASEQIQYELGIRDRRHDAYVKRLGARRIQFSGAESFPLGGTAFAPATQGPHPAIVTLIAPDDSLPSWDSLGVKLRAAGFASLFIDGRGSGWSVARAAPLPASWNGRHGVLVDRTASDVREGLRALGLTTKLDTTRYTVMASGSMAMPALLAAERDPRVQSVVLISPDLSDVERGPGRDLVRRIQVPLYLIETKIDRLNHRWIEPLYQAAPAGISRIADAAGNGTGPETLGSDAPGVERLTKWLREKKPARATAPPRGTPRRG